MGGRGEDPCPKWHIADQKACLREKCSHAKVPPFNCRSHLKWRRFNHIRTLLRRVQYHVALSALYSVGFVKLEALQRGIMGSKFSRD